MSRHYSITQVPKYTGNQIHKQRTKQGQKRTIIQMQKYAIWEGFHNNNKKGKLSTFCG